MSEIREAKDALYGQIARIGKSLSNGPRLEILDLLSQGPCSVEVIASQIGQAVANTSRHLQVLKQGRLVESSKDGLRVHYRLASPQVATLFVTLRDLAQDRLLEMAQICEQAFEPWSALVPLERASLIAKMESGDVVLLDVRPSQEFAAGRLPGAVSIPVDELEARLSELPKDQEIVAYCRGPYCVMALEAVQLLQTKGFAATHYKEGVADWRADGKALEADSQGGAA